MATLQRTVFDTTQYVRISVGTNANRPGSPTAGQMRFNTDTGLVETWNGSAWVNMIEQVLPEMNIVEFIAPGSHVFNVPTGIQAVEVLVVAGGGGGGGLGGGGGGGGVIHLPEYPVTPGGSVALTVGAGGAGGPGNPSNAGDQGGPSTFGSVTAVGGGGGAGHQTRAASSGGSGGGGSYANLTGAGGTVGQGFGGGSYPSYGPPHANSGGGGAGGPGGDGNGSNGGEGGVGRAVGIRGYLEMFGGGGAGGGHGPQSGGGAGGIGGGGGGGYGLPNSGYQGPAGHYRQNRAPDAAEGASGLGGGGGGSGHVGGPQPYGIAGRGGPGIVIVRY